MKHSLAVVPRFFTKSGKILSGPADLQFFKVQSDLNKVVQVDPGTVRSIYAAYGQNMTSARMRAVVERWGQFIPQQALRLSLIIMQAANTGLTALMVVYKAMKQCSDFPWGKLEVILPGEIQAYHRAIMTVNGDPYYGYNRNLGPVASTNYKNLSYVAKELCKRILGDGAIEGYGGWTRIPRAKVTLDAMIQYYEESRALRMGGMDTLQRDMQEQARAHMIPQEIEGMIQEIRNAPDPTGA